MAYKITTATTKLLQLKKRLRCVCGGTSASKTISILMILIDYAQSNTNKTIDVMSESYPHLEGGAIKDFKNIMLDRLYWKDDNWNASKHYYTFETGSVIKFISIDRLGKAHGPRRDVLFINEANNISYEIYDQLEVRTKDLVWLDWNPTNEFWYYSEIKDKLDHDFITLTYLDCLDVLDPNIIRSIEAHKGNKNWWAVYGLGQLGEVEGKIYKDWQIIDEIPHEARLERYGLDFGYSNDPTSIIAIYKYNGGFILDEVTYQKGLSNKQIADILINQPQALVIADSAEPKSIDEIKLYGINILPSQKGPGSVNQGIQFVQAQRISMTKRSLNLIKEYRNYLWKTDKDGKILNVPDGGFEHCLTGDTLITMADGSNKRLDKIKPGDTVKTRKGNNRVLLSRLTRKNADIYEIILSNGYKLRGTGDHKIFTNRGKIAIDALRYDDIIKVLNTNLISLWKRQSFTTIKDLTGMVNIIANQVDTEKIIRDFTKKYGKTITELSPTDTTFTTLTKIEQIIQLIILNLKKLESIYQNTLKECGQKKALKKKCQHILIMLESLQRNGTRLKKEMNGIESKEKRLGLVEKQLRKNARCVEKNLKRIVPQLQDFAITIVERKRCGQEDVYNLTVENEHNYYANGVLVKNCMDAVRYGLDSYRNTNSTEVYTPLFDMN